MVRTLPVGVAIADPRGRIITGNDALRGLWDSDKPLPENINDWPPLVGRLTETGEPLHLRDWLISRSVLRGEAVLGVTIDILSLSGKTKTILYSAVPIIEPGGGVAGGVAVTQEITQQRLLEMQAQTAAREAQQRADELEGLHRATAALLSTLDLDELLCQILDAAQSAIPAAERGMLHLVSPADGQLHARATLGFNDERICVIPPDGEPGYPAGLVNAARPLIVADTRSKGSELPANMLPERMRDARSVILAPLTVGERMLGTLSLSAAAPDAFSDSNLRLLASFAATTTAALQNALLHAEIKQLAVTDPLTGRYNRRAFFELGQRELERFMRFRHPLTAMMIDLDHFKHINDRYGHVSGDQILRGLAERIATTIRDTDIFARYGGDEFVLLLPDSEISVALRIASRIREAVNHASWDTDGSQEPISVSMGLAQASPQHHMLEELLAEADQALYQAKTGGRDRVEVFQRQA
jgi:diguanylate cyclase (GGDEF)-like protein